jgi:hypothetical protein
VQVPADTCVVFLSSLCLRNVTWHILLCIALVHVVMGIWHDNTGGTDINAVCKYVLLWI